MSKTLYSHGAVLVDFRFRSVLYIKATGPSYSIHINKHIYKHSCVHIVLILNSIYILNDFLPYKYIRQF